MQSHYPDAKVIQTGQGCPSTEKKKIYPARPVEPGSPREIFISNSGAYFTGVLSGCSTGVKFEDYLTGALTYSTGELYTISYELFLSRRSSERYPLTNHTHSRNLTTT